MRIKAIILVVFLTGNLAFGQQLPVYSQYLYNKFLINPSIAGSDGYTSVSLTAREQWVGYGGAPINVYRVGNRLILNNGFHRVFALRSLGVTKIPVLVQHIANWQLEFPPAVGNLPREYLLSAPRPVLIKDFFQDGFSITLRAKQKVKSIVLQTAVNQVDIPS